MKELNDWHFKLNSKGDIDGARLKKTDPNFTKINKFLKACLDYILTCRPYFKSEVKIKSEDLEVVINSIAKHNGSNLIFGSKANNITRTALGKLIENSPIKKTHAQIICNTYHALRIAQKNLNSSITEKITLERTELLDIHTIWELYKDEIPSSTIVGTQWIVYSIKKKIPDATSPHTEVSLIRGFLEFFNKDVVEYKGEHTVYTGNYEITSNFIDISLSQKKLHKSENPLLLRINILCPKKDSMYMEGFMNILAPDPVIFSKAILLQKPASSNPELSIIPLYSKKYYKLSKGIRDFFARMELNWNRTKKGAIENLVKESKDKNKVSRVFPNDLYLAIPVSSYGSLLGQQQNDEHKEILFEMVQDISLEIIKLLQKSYKRNVKNEKHILGNSYTPLQRIECAALNQMQQKISYSTAFKNPLDKEYYEEGLARFFDSKYFFLFLPFDVPSTALMQSSWVFTKPVDDIKPSVFIIADGVRPPNILKGTARLFRERTHLIRVTPFKKESIDNPKAILDYISYIKSVLLEEEEAIKRVFSVTY